MESILGDMIAEETPKFNPVIVDGLAVEELSNPAQYIDQIWRTVALWFPEGMTYDGYELCTPQEEYNEITSKRNGKRLCEIAKSYLYLVRFNLSLHGVPLYPRYLHLPYVLDAGIMVLRGSRFAISPVLADRAISAESDSLFIPLNCAKLKFERVVQHYRVGGEGDGESGQRETVNVIWSPVHNSCNKPRRDGTRATVDVRTTLVHYLFCRQGVTKTFEQFTNTTVVVGGPEVNERTYPADKWVICSSVQLRPKGFKGRLYQPSEIRLAIPVKRYEIYENRALIAGFFYIVDHFPDLIEPEFIDEVDLWRVLLGHAIFATNTSEGEILNKIEAHLDFLDEYIDGMSQETLRQDGVEVNDIYDLFMHVIETMSERLLNPGEPVSSMYGKRLTVKHYVLFDIIKAIMTLRFKLTTANKKKPVTIDDVNKLMNRELGRDLITKINRRHGEVSSVSSPGDNKYFKITSNIVMQTKSSSVRGRSKGKLSDPAKALHVSIADVGSYLNLPPSDPTGQSKVSPYLELEPDRTVKRREEYREELDRAQLRIQQ